ncbi:hypothetical protein [Polaromonas hydrogenivorans]|uniref:Uncharacterized protein n=1 Tax=Polaromonas hydrogenivorans TaxID=335476 RepID=A0AAU7LYN5_9BURK
MAGDSYADAQPARNQLDPISECLQPMERKSSNAASMAASTAFDQEPKLAEIGLLIFHRFCPGAILIFTAG